MAYYAFKKDNQSKESPAQGESFLKVPRERQFLPAEKQYRIRIMPPWSPEGLFSRGVKTHWRVGVTQLSFVCPDVFELGSCPLCPTYLYLRNDYDNNKADVDKSRPARRWYSNCVVLNEAGKGVQVYAYGKKVYSMLMGFVESGDYGDITDPANGYDLTLIRTGSGRQVSDVLYPGKAPKAIDDPAWLDDLFDLDAVFLRPSLDDVKAAVNTIQWDTYSPGGGKSTSIPAPTAKPPAPMDPKIAAMLGDALHNKPTTMTPAVEEATQEAVVAIAKPQQAELPLAPSDQGQNKVADLNALEQRLRAKLGTPASTTEA